MKKLLAILLPIAALVFVLYAYGKTRPPEVPNAPVSVRLEKNEAQRIEDSFEYGIDSLKISDEQREQLKKWLAADKKLSGKERQEHRKELKEILPEDQLSIFQDVRKEYAERQKQLREVKHERVMRVVGDSDYQKYQEDQKKIRDQQKERQEAARAAEQERKASEEQKQ